MESKKQLTAEKQAKEKAETQFKDTLQDKAELYGHQLAKLQLRVNTLIREKEDAITAAKEQLQTESAAKNKTQNSLKPIRPKFFFIFFTINPCH